MELRLWSTRSVPEMGFYTQERRFGFYQRKKDTGRVRTTVRHLPAGDVPTFLENLREYSDDEEIRFYPDGRELDERLGPVLLDSGCTPDVAEVYRRLRRARFIGLTPTLMCNCSGREGGEVRSGRALRSRPQV